MRTSTPGRQCHGPSPALIVLNAHLDHDLLLQKYGQEEESGNLTRPHIVKIKRHVNYGLIKRFKRYYSLNNTNYNTTWFVIPVTFQTKVLWKTIVVFHAPIKTLHRNIALVSNSTPMMRSTDL